MNSKMKRIAGYSPIICHAFEENTDGVIYGDSQSQEKMSDLPSDHGEEG
jgi:hypothetical protein